MNLKTYWKKWALAVAGAGLACTIPTIASAVVQGTCATCHTMHNSQDGSDVAAGGPFGALTNANGCVGCHTGTNDGTNVIPYVLSGGAPTYTSADGTTGNTLAGGNFYWVATAGGGTDSFGHNVNGISNPDGQLGGTPPGGAATDINSAAQLTCGGLSGCHGDRTAADDFTAVSGAHHVDDTGGITGASTGLSFRFLNGVLGKEDSDWEYQPTASAHNQYKGVDRTDDTTNTPSTISSLCAQCHGNYHNSNGGTGDIDGGTWGSAWVRHPTDFDMGNAGGEYTGYNDTGSPSAAAYSVEAPVASADVSAVLTTVDVDGTGSDTAIVTCISCHRAHGTPYADLLRWDYSTMIAGSVADAGKGCFVCHTTKDG